MKIFVSSTVNDLKMERNALKKALKQYSFDAYLSEHDGADWAASCTKCLSELESSDIYVLMVGERYGSIPDKHEDSEVYDGKTSVTHGEFKKALQLNKPVLVYVKKVAKRDKDAVTFVKHLEAFYDGYFRKTFSNEKELSGFVRADVLRLITEVFRGTYRYPKLRKPQIVLCKDRNELFSVGSQMISFVLETERLPVLGFMPGRTAGGVYDQLIAAINSKNKLAGLQEMRAFHVAEHFGVAASSPSSYQNWMNTSLYGRIEKAHSIRLDRRRIHFIPGTVSGSTMESECQKYDSLVSSHTIHLQLLGIAPNGQTMTVDPDTYEGDQLLEQQTSLVKMSPETFGYLRPKPPIPYGVTIGMGNVLKFSKRIALLAFGKDKSLAIRHLLTTINYKTSPCSILKHHFDFWIVIDQEAASALPSGWIDYFNPTSGSCFSQETLV
ncbi:MAG: DUF4062 domain-containing protein [Candidatus Eisenbacteria bacterium]|uniref:DUF4062 domain-containing protein n=1 Tax=Eiseniibacteriota bacterium TaxID=2212470 RepID=A0A948W3M2_UNCEI|nr:DUF4062 domain-containing protein [Candidatus Eisenbacteria bacterium]MBU2691252.1 DUF4062 domain-containing protein [Candidatus Eisenbacteria bacterium]